jgi:hypothetical protein
MTPDDMEGRLLARLSVLYDDARNGTPVTDPNEHDADELAEIISDLRALLLAYQERGRALAASSPVVPVGVSEEVEIIEDWLAMAKSCQLVGGIVRHVPMCQTEIDAIDAILAALRPTDTGWRDIATAPKDGSDILILASGMAIEARYAPGAWGPDVPGEVQEYDGPVWVAFDDLTQFEIEEGVLEGGQDHHGAVTHWMPLPPAPTDTGRE